MSFSTLSYNKSARKAPLLYRCGKRLILSTLASTLLSSMCCQIAESAMPGMDSEAERIALSDNAPEKNAAARTLSGSPWPGAIDHLLQKSVDEKGAAAIHINYPSLGLPRVDSDIRHWVEGLANAFESHLDLKSFLPEEMERQTLTEAGPFLQDNDLYSEQPLSETENQANFELWGDYSISRPSPAAVSITYELWNYTGQPQGNLDILVLNYNLNNGQRLGLVDIFENPDRALELMSDWSRKELEKKLGNMRRPMLELGTEPLVENFSSLTLVPDGIHINFQPLQVAPWEAGIQKVKMPLEELMPASPLLFLWGK